jgi:hypothetical protein
VLRFQEVYAAALQQPIQTKRLPDALTAQL